MAVKILSKVTGTRNPDEHEIPKKSLITSATNVERGYLDQNEMTDQRLVIATARIERDAAKFRRDTTPVSFLQIEDPKTKAVNLLKKAASSSHSKKLEKL